MEQDYWNENFNGTANVRNPAKKLKRWGRYVQTILSTGGP
jgi:hypothetical protein